MKNSLDGPKTRFEMVEESISKYKNRIKIINSKKRKKQEKIKTLRDQWDNLKYPNGKFKMRKRQKKYLKK